MDSVIVKGLEKTWPYTVIPTNFLCCSGGLWSLANAIKYGYGMSMVSNGAITLLMNRDKVNTSNLQSVCHAGLAMVYGARLTEFLYRRSSNPSYAEKTKERWAKADAASFGKKVAFVTYITGLMSAYIIPLMYNFKADNDKNQTKVIKKSWVSWLGVGFAAVGIILQLFSDEQKLKHKESSGGCIMHGFYKFIRHPNYTGEALFHVGMFLSGFDAYASWKEMLYAAIAPGLLTFVIVKATKKLEIKQMEKYGDNPEYKAWRKSSWSLIPFVY